ncbi:MAG: DUF5916 domain-containing protein [Acidobacteriota bacterium]
MASKVEVCLLCVWPRWAGRGAVGGSWSVLAVLVSVLAALAVGKAGAQEVERARPSIAALRFDPAIDGEMSLDGRLDEVVWGRAEVGGDFVQRQPEEFEPSSERTDLRIVYSASMLYVGIDAFDREPERIVAREMGLDPPLFRDDGLVLLLDTFHDRRNAYFFETNPNASRTDGLMTDEGDNFSTDWDGIWQVATHRHAGGWTAEFAIPFSTLRFDAASSTWGLQVRRVIRRRAEFAFWAPIGLQANLFRMSQGGTITGLEGLEPGLAMRFTPYLAVSDASARERRAPDDGFDGGADLKWGITRGMSLDLTVNTDFAETEVDEAQTNLTRFSLFFPEKRDFFLENAGIFRFGPNLGSLLRPFFSRRIGIASDGRRVDLEGGVRMAGRQGPWSVGLLTARTGDLEADDEQGLDAVPTTDWAVARVKRNVGARSSIGGLATWRDAGGLVNRMAGADLSWKPSDEVTVWAFGAASDDERRIDSETAGERLERRETIDGWAGGLGANWSGSDRWIEASVLEIDDEFSPEVGFLLRRGVRRYALEAGWEPRPEISWLPSLRNLFFELEADRYERRGVDAARAAARADVGVVESQSVELNWIGGFFGQGDFFTAWSALKRESLLDPFEIFPDVVVPAGDYEFEEHGLYIDTGSGRELAGSATLVVGEIFDGDRLSFDTTVRWRPSRFFRSETTWSYEDIELPSGAFDTAIWRQRLAVSLSPEAGATALLQYIEAIERLTLNLRLQWHYRPGSDLFLVFNQGWDAPELRDLSFGSLARRDRQVVLKATYTWQG